MNLRAQIARNGHCMRLTKSAPSKKTKKRLNRVSKNREGANRQYAKLRKDYLLLHPYCEAHDTIDKWLYAHDRLAWHEMPDGILLSKEIHHKRKPKAKYLNDTTTWVAVSEWAHRWIEQHKNLARQLGLLDNV